MARIASNHLAIGGRILLLRRLFLALGMVCFGAMAATGQVTRLYNTTRTTGIIQELDLVSGAVLASNVGGITDGRGMDFSPLGGLYVANGNNVSVIPTIASAAFTVLTYVGETPHDLCFDDVGNLYVITDLRVHVYNTAMVQTLTFLHGLATTTGDGNTNKGWGIEIRPDNGEIYAVGAAGMKRFSPATGLQIGSTIAGSAFGLAGIKFTGSGFSGAYCYVGNVISGVDQIRVYDTGLNLLRTFFAAHNGNPIDLEVNPANGDLYLFNTVVSNPANRFSSTEVVNGSFSAAANPTRGSALGSFEPILAANGLHLQLENAATGVDLEWTVDEEAGELYKFKLSRSTNGRQFVDFAEVDAILGTLAYEFQDNTAAAGRSWYRVTAIDVNGNASMASTMSIFRAQSLITIHQSASEPEIAIVSHAAGTDQLQLTVFNLDGKTITKMNLNGNQANIPIPAQSAGIYWMQVNAIDSHGSVIASKRQQISLLR